MQARLPTAAEVERAVATVYARPEFTPRESVWTPVLRWIGRLFGRFLEWLGAFRAMESTSPILFWLIMAWLVIAAVAIVAHLVWSAYQSARRQDRRVTEKRDEARGRPKTAADWDDEARRAAAAGRLREAALALYQALVLRLDARGAVRFDPAKTPGDYRREARAHPDVARALGAFLRGFEPVAFGGRPLDAGGYERLRAAATEAGSHA